MGTRRRWGPLAMGGALVLTFIILVAVGTVRTDQSPSALPNQGTVPAQQQPAAWMHKLAPGEKPPQFVLFSFDGAGSHDHWQRVLPIAEKAHAHFSGFLSGIYLLTDEQRSRYTGPGHGPGKASINFGGSTKDVQVLIDDLNTAVGKGNEIGTHYNGHFCKGSEPSVGRWNTGQWNVELDQFFGYVNAANGMGLRVDQHAIKGGRTPCLEGQFDQLFPALAARGMDYDSSQISDGVAWPQLQNGVWEFWMPLVKVPGLNHKKVIMMDYNLWFALNRAKEDPAKSDRFTKVTLETYRGAYDAALKGNRAPLVVGNHFNDWAGGAFSTATEQFMGEVCVKADTVCATYSEVTQWLRLQDPKVLAEFRAMPPAQIA